ncbi:hypothetical protein AJ79_06199 [Helicocarpus griseus UAMH5409]|uniref:Ubiquitin-like domain-containing protein n=1 Tax=Helicocarpus griseus UAMH5409 TaxID=1447875 RepID=A0A2B7XG92_9EURO|nr:hypothetical protein AJ79_06199 [Helicocarpus griseus UAMH5409]
MSSSSRDTSIDFKPGESDTTPAPASPTAPILNRTSASETAQTTHHRSATTRSARSHRVLAGVPLDVHYNQAIRPHIWQSTRREWTHEQLARERELFFDTRVTGRPEVWAALSTVTSLIRTGDLITAQGILDAAGVTVPTGDICDGCYDESGGLYRLPEYIVMDPVNVVESVDVNDNNTICATTADLGDEEAANNKLAVDVDSDEELTDDIARRREEKGKVSERDLIKITARLSDRGGPDLVVTIGKNQTVAALARRIQVEAGITGKHRVRIAYLGKMLKEEESLSLRRTVSNLQDSVGDLKGSRSRFISTYKRDILLNATPTDHRIIATGNRFVHGGDCKRDADLYEHPGRRRDFDIYVKLYGLHPGIVRSSISYTATIDLLDTHATIIADKKIKVPTDFHDLFDDFIRSLERSNYDEEYLSDPMSRVTLAYWAFLKACPA